MKRILSLFLVSVMLIGTFSACKKNAPEPVAPPEPEVVYTYQNGTYSVEYEVPALDRMLDYLTLSITDDKITVTDVGCKEGAPAPVESSSGESTGASGIPAEPVISDTAAASAASSGAVSVSAESENQDKANQQMKKIAEEFQAVNCEVDKMEVIEGAEEHSYRFMRMVREALKAAKTGDTQKRILGQYADGSYESTMPVFNADGWKEFVQLTVADGKISSIIFDATNENNDALHITEEPLLNKPDAKVKPSVFYPAIAKSFTDADGSLDALVVPDGGAAATKSFKRLLKPLLNTMIADGEKKITAPKYMDGTYKAQMQDFDANGWKDYVVVKIRNDEVSIKEFDAIAKEGEDKLKSKDTELADKMSKKTGTEPTAYSKGLSDNLKKTKGDPIAMDGVAGATVSSNNFRLLVGQILATSAVSGDAEATLEVESFPDDMAKVIK